MLFGVNFIVLLVWTLVDPQEWVRIPVNDGSDGSSSSSGLVDEPTAGWCYSDNTRLYLGIILGTNFVMMMVAIIQAYECRRITTEYSESLWISGSIACIAQIWIIGLPILRLVEGDPQAIFLTKVGVIFGSSILTLILMFGPKFSYLRDSLEGQQHAARVKKARQEGSKGGGMRVSRHGQSSQQHHLSETDSDEDFDNRSWAKSLVTPNPGPAVANEGTMQGGSHPPPASTRRKGEPKGALGIRVIPTTVLNSDEVDRLQTAVDRAERRNKLLQGSLEKLQEKLELYVIARDPLGSNNNAAAAAATPAATSSSGSTAVGPSYTVHNTSDPLYVGSGPSHQRNRVGRGSILAARPEGLLGSASRLDESMPFQK
jgi:hypothetical protein